MYSSEDFERLFIRYKGESYPKGESIQTFCHRNNVPYNLFEKWYKDTRHKVVEVSVSGRPSPQEEEKSKENAQQKEEIVREVRILVNLRVSAAYHSVVSTCKLQGYLILEYLKKFFAEIVVGNRDYGKLMPSTIGISANKI